MRRLLSGLKKRFISILNLLPINSAIVGTPRKTDTLNSYALRHELTVLGLTERSAITLPLPIMNVPEVPAEYLFVHERSAPEQQVMILDNGRIWGRNGAVVTSDDYFIEDVSREFGVKENHRQHSVFHNLSLGKPEYVDANVAVVTTAGAGVYYHWMLDVLPRIIMLKEAGVFDDIDYFVVDYSDNKFQKETLKGIGVENKQLIRCGDDRNFHLQAKKLYVPTLPSELSKVNKYECDLLRKYFLKNGAGFAGIGKRIYISRGSSGSRILINENELLEYLEGNGFEIIYPEQYTVQEQASIFNRAEIIIGPHGSAFANVLFSEPGAKLVDIVPDTNIVPCFYNIAAVSGVQYFGFIGKGVAVNDSFKNDNIQIDMMEFKSFFEEKVINS